MITDDQEEKAELHRLKNLSESVDQKGEGEEKKGEGRREDGVAMVSVCHCKSCVFCEVH